MKNKNLYSFLIFLIKSKEIVGTSTHTMNNYSYSLPVYQNIQQLPILTNQPFNFYYIGLANKYEHHLSNISKEQSSKESLTKSWNNVLISEESQKFSEKNNTTDKIKKLDLPESNDIIAFCLRKIDDYEKLSELYLENGKLNATVLKDICDNQFFKSQWIIKGFKCISKKFLPRKVDDNFTIWIYSYSATLRSFIEGLMEKKFDKVHKKLIINLWEYFKYFFLFNSAGESRPKSHIFKAYYLGTVNPNKVIGILPEYYENLFFKKDKSRKYIIEVLNRYESAQKDVISLLEWSLEAFSTQEAYNRLVESRSKAYDNKNVIKLYNLLVIQEMTSPTFIIKIKKCYETYKNDAIKLNLPKEAIKNLDNYFLKIVKNVSKRIYEIFKIVYVLNNAYNDKYIKIVNDIGEKTIRENDEEFFGIMLPIINSLVFRNEEDIKFSVFNTISLLKYACFSINSMIKITFNHSFYHLNSDYRVNRVFEYLLISYLKYENIEMFFQVNYDLYMKIKRI